MTTPLRFNRKVRAVHGGIPPDLLAWFAGEDPPPGESWPPWSALLSPDHEKLEARWVQFKRSHPKATPPEGYAALIAEHGGADA